MANEEIDIDIDNETPDREDILEAPVSQLKEWYVGLDEKAMRMREFLEAHKISGVQTATWMIRATDALAHTKVAMRFIERRLRSLNETVPYPPTDKLVRQVQMLEDKVIRLRKAAIDGDLALVREITKKERY